ncbi:MAG: TIR domain-containing protein [Gemmataceae bacterium]
MENRELVWKLLDLGVTAYHKNPATYADPSSDSALQNVGAAAIAGWLEELGKHRLIGHVQPQFSKHGAGFRYEVTKEAARLWSNPQELERFLDRIVPTTPTFDIFLSYATGDSELAAELKELLECEGLRCFMAEKDIPVASEWQGIIRSALLGSKRILLLLSQRSLNRPWVLMETGAAWALGKDLIPALVQVSPNELIDPIRRYQGRIIETIAQRKALVKELAAPLPQPKQRPGPGLCKGMITHIAPDFDAPLEDMREYME